MLLIGSQAILKQDPTWEATPKDYDYIVPELPKEKVRGMDVHSVPRPLYSFLRSWCDNDGVMSLEGSYNLKISHAQFDVHWDKTASHIIKMQEKYGFRKTDDEFFNTLYPFWLNYHKNNKHKVNMKQTPKDFFNDAITRKYPHDKLHAATCYYEHPLFTRCQYPGQSSVECHKELFDELNPLDQLRFVREEAYVVALERYVIPNSEGQHRRVTPTAAYRMALKKLIISMTEGWFPRFVTENLCDLKSPDCNYVSNFYIRNLQNA